MADAPQLKTTVVRGTRPGPHLLITGGVHGDEFEPMAAVRRLARLVRPEQLAGIVTMIPVVNEAAFLRGARTAEDGLDLARTCPGDAGGSTTERAANALARQIRTADFYIDLHTGGTILAVYPLAGYMLHQDAGILGRQRQMARAFNLPVVWGTDPGLQGRSLSVARDARVPAIYVEHGGAATCDPERVAGMVNGCLNVLGALGMLDRSQPPSRVRWVVEDARPGSGHMQRAHPAPRSGFFEPAVALGNMVEAGQPVGRVVDTQGDDQQVVPADCSGLVLALRTFPAVREGDSLAVVLEIEEANRRETS